MRIYFNGGEIGSYRALLQDAGANHIALSYMGLRRRVKFARPWVISDKFAPGTSVFLDSGAFTVNSGGESDPYDIEEVADHYKQFVTDNIDSLDLVSEFDAVSMGQEWIEAERRAFYDTLPREKFMPIWHLDAGLPGISALAERYEVVGVPAVSLDGKNLTPFLNALAARGTRLHGVGTTKMASMQEISWDSVASTSWLSPVKFGDMIIWTGKELKRYPRKYQEQARKRHRTLFADNGFDPDKITSGDDREILRLTVWSWLKFEESINKHQRTGHRATQRPPGVEGGNVQDSTAVVVHSGPGDAKALTTEPVGAKPLRVRDPVLLPGISMVQEHTEDEEDSPPLLNVRGTSSRRCDNCFLAQKCPAFEPDSTCAYSIPISVGTRQEFKALQQGMLSMQAQRVMFMRFVEDQEGGYADPNLSKEIGLLNKMMAQYSRDEQEGFDLQLRVRGNPEASSGGVMSRIFGSAVGQKVSQIGMAPQSADDIIEAEILDDGKGV